MIETIETIFFPPQALCPHGRTVSFVVASDDVRWCLETLVPLDPETVVVSPLETPEEDMALMAHADHGIRT